MELSTEFATFIALNWLPHTCLSQNVSCNYLEEIIKNISEAKGCNFAMEESTWFNGEMNVPVKTYRLNYTTQGSKINLTGEYRRNTWRKANWYKNIHSIDVYLWTIKLESNHKIPEFEISKNSWLQTKIFNLDRLDIKSDNKALKKRLKTIEILNDLLDGNEEKVSATIRGDGKIIWTSFNTLIEHNNLIGKALLAFEKIGNEIKN